MRTTEDAVRDRAETTDLERVLEVEEKDPGFAAARERRRSPGADPLEGASVPVRQAARDLGGRSELLTDGGKGWWLAWRPWQEPEARPT